LEAGQSTDHDNTSTETLGGKGNETGLGGDGAEGLALVLGLAQQGDQRVSGVGNDGANDTREVTRTEGDSELSGLAVGFFRGGEDVSVEELDDLLEEVELGHSVWDLSRPERDEGTEGEPGFNGGSPHLGKSGAHGDREGTSGAGLDLDLGHLPRAKGNIGEDLSRGGTSQPDGTLVVVAGLLTCEVHVGVFEELVETILEGTLEGVANQGRPEALPGTGDTLLGDDGSETGNETLVLGGVDLHVTLGNIERSDSGVGGTASQDTTE
jgi:hypothetical protein